MKIFNIVIIFLILQNLTNIKSQTESSPEDQLPNPDEPQEDTKNKVESSNREISSEKKTRPTESPETTKLPMNCIHDYVKYCQNKFIGFKFNDGCHECECKVNKKDFCPKGPCIYYVNSFEEAADYCPKIEKQNKDKYEIYRKQHQKLETKKEKTKVVKSMNINKVQSMNKNNNESIIKKQVVKVESSKPEPKDSNMDLLNFLKKKTIEKNLDKKLNKEINRKSPLDIDTLNKPITKITETNNGNFEEKSIEKANSKPLENSNETAIEKEVKPKDDEIGKLDEISKLKTKILKPIKSFPENITKILSNDFTLSNDTKIQNNPVKVSLAKMSTITIIKAMIYQLASNELTIDRLKKKFKGKHMRKKTLEKIFRKLNHIAKSNSKYKMKILTLVKKEIVKNKNKKSHKKLGKKKIIVFKQILSKLLSLHKALEDMKSDKFIKAKGYHGRRRRRRYYKGTENLKVSFIITTLSVILVFIFFKC